MGASSFDSGGANVASAWLWGVRGAVPSSMALTVLMSSSAPIGARRSKSSPLVSAGPISVSEGNTIEEAAQVSEEVAASAPDKYYIVLASAISLSNAERYTGELQKRGMQNAQVMAKGKMVRVVLDGYASEEEAVSHLRQLRHNNNEFENAWVLHL